jgi:solute carrier family 6 (neurotransmitter transporter, glycine) member 5/9
MIQFLHFLTVLNDSGVGTGQVLSSLFVATYYSSIMGLTLKYLYESIFSIDLPWGHCKEEWGDCVSAVNDTSNNGSLVITNETRSSAELYFR